MGSLGLGVATERPQVDDLLHLIGIAVDDLAIGIAHDVDLLADEADGDLALRCPAGSAAATSDASKPISVVSAFSLRSARPRIAASKLPKVGPIEQRAQRRRVALGEGLDDGGEGGARAGGETDRLEAGVGGANGRDAGEAVGMTVARMPPGPVVDSEGRGAGALAVGSGTTLSLPVWPEAGVSPTPRLRRRRCAAA